MYCKIIYALCVLVQCAVGQIVSTPCSDIPSVSNLDLQRFQGTWFEIESANQNPSSCGRLDLEVFTEAGVTGLTIDNSRLLENEMLHVSGVIISPMNSGALIVTMVPGDIPIILYQYILATDYDNYALLLQCSVEPDGRSVMAWKLSRSRDGLSSASTVSINTAAAANTDIASATWQSRDQSVETCDSDSSSAAVTVASTLLLAVLAVVNLARST